MVLTVFYESLHNILVSLVEYAVIFTEFIGLLIIIVSSCRALYSWVKKHPQIKLKLAEGLALGLEFKLGGEILRTVVVRDLSEIVQVAAIIALRAALTFLIHWEIKNEKVSEEITKE